MNLDILKNRKIGLLAVIGPAYALGSIAAAIMLSPWFSWTNNAISDLGVHPVAPIFNISLMICGFMCGVFSISMFARLKHGLGRIGILLMLGACIALVGIGAFTENSPPWHYYFSVAFFVLLLLTSILMGLYFLMRRPTKYLGIFALAVAVIGIMGWSIDWGAGIAIPEAMTFVPGGLWFMTLGLWFYRTGHTQCPGEQKNRLQSSQ